MKPKLKFILSCICYSVLILSLNFSSPLGLTKEIPNISLPVYDEVGLLSRETTNELNQKLIDVFKRSEVQLQVMILNSLENENLEDYSIRVVEKLKLGNQKSEKGVLLLLALQERKIRIEVGRGLEGDLTDLESNRIIEFMGTYLRHKDFDSAILIAVSQILTCAKVENLNQYGLDNTIATDFQATNQFILRITIILFLFFIGFFWVMVFINRNRYRTGFGGYNSENIFRHNNSSYHGRSSGSFGNFRGGGSWGGGGGSFGGGGSSGSW